MTKEDIEKVVACCRKENCTGCSFYKLNGCLAVVDYIKELKVENARLNEEVVGLTGALEAKQTDCDNLTRTLEEANENNPFKAKEGQMTCNSCIHYKRCVELNSGTAEHLDGCEICKSYDAAKDNMGCKNG